MILITGGTGHGKQTLIRKKYNPIITDGAECTPEEAMAAKGLIHFHLLVKKLAESGIDPVKWTTNFCEQNPHCIVSITEIGCGIVPLDKCERIWREQTGQCGCILAEHAETIIRMTCGIPAVLKGAMP